jgi:mannitol-1-phosphate 5-dehydrogenase
MPKQQQAIIFGAGNVGRGFLGQLFSESGYEVVFVDVDEPLIAALNDRQAYAIRLVDNDGAEEVTVAPVRAYHASESQAVAGTLAKAGLAATAVGVRALPHIASLVAAGIEQRARGQDAAAPPDLNIIVCENMQHAAATLRQMVSQHLSPAAQGYAEEHVGFVDTVIARMVPPPTPEMRQEDPSLIAVEPYKELPVDRSGFVGPIPEIVGMQPHDHFVVYTHRKLYVHNCAHAMLGYLGARRGHTYGYEALEDPAIRPLLVAALDESKAGLVAAYGVAPAALQTHIGDILQRLANRALGDTVFRLARDPLRKLGPEDRLVGAARLAQQAGVAPAALSWGIAAAACFDDEDDPLAVQLQQRIATEGFDRVLADVSGIAPDEPLAALVRDRVARLRSGSWP